MYKRCKELKRNRRLWKAIISHVVKEHRTKKKKKKRLVLVGICGFPVSPVSEWNLNKSLVIDR